MVQEWIKEMNESQLSFSEDEMVEKMQECLKIAEMQVIKELVNEHIDGSTMDESERKKRFPLRVMAISAVILMD